MRNLLQIEELCAIIIKQESGFKNLFIFFEGF